ncbi:hypothetical protein B4135_3104 [Caldibacillus debilis]|uniref:Uncharacterized protein n=1 Tax=Caldibacillus debilis TaxID=301148 RepID=A0A150LIW4_9BACI|nr:hypothetical protein B4135_3104 [Caldibacillus debilis]
MKGTEKVYVFYFIDIIILLQAHYGMPFPISIPAGFRIFGK